MNISLFLKQVHRIERSGWVNLDTDQLLLGEKSQTISWELLQYRNFRLHYGVNDSSATLFVMEKGMKEKLLQIRLFVTEDPSPVVDLFMEKLATILHAAQDCDSVLQS